MCVCNFYVSMIPGWIMLKLQYPLTVYPGSPGRPSGPMTPSWPCRGRGNAQNRLTNPGSPCFLVFFLYFYTSLAKYTNNNVGGRSARHQTEQSCCGLLNKIWGFYRLLSSLCFSTHFIWRSSLVISDLPEVLWSPWPPSARPPRAGPGPRRSPALQPHLGVPSLPEVRRGDNLENMKDAEAWREGSKELNKPPSKEAGLARTQIPSCFPLSRTRS